MAISEGFDRRLFERRLFLFIAIVSATVTFVGFARTYYLVPVIGGDPLRMVTHAHGILMSAWVLLFAAQVYLIRSKSIKLHMRLGWAGVALAVMVTFVGALTALYAAKYGSPSSPPGISPLQFLIVPIGDVALFAAFFGFAVLWRKRPADHKRMMLLTAINFLPPAVARIPGAPMQALGPIWFFGIPDLLLLAIIGYDRWRTGKFNIPLVVGAAVLIASHPLRLMAMGSASWNSFAVWATSLV